MSVTLTRDDGLPCSQPYTAKSVSCCAIVLGNIIILCAPICLVFVCLTIYYNAFVETSYAEIPTIKIDSITVSSFNLSNPMSAHWNINMTMHTTDSSLDFPDSSISFFHKSKEDALWMTRLKGFNMRPENTTVHFALDFGGLVHVNDTTVRAIGDQITNNHGAVEFNVQFKADHPRGRKIDPLRKFFRGIEVNMLIICSDVLLLFESPDKTRAYMLMTNNQAWEVVHPVYMRSHSVRYLIY
ncbi:hypothetical protein POM88_033084 [Heracleum sosnowskyi]|uniref:Uncharacterized protein n=1 Tax=Heracleum sosnowskyi TaxID=360622 RepID=A0AAD8MKP9_9APIA|nr:hypothetical protein POM88_033084 [Heracleum sosnowskyi]